MKKIILSLLACVGLMTSCSMDTEQPGVLDDKTAIDSAINARYFRNILYSGFRGRTTGYLVYATELQMDQFVGLSSNGGRGMDANGGDINSSYSNATSAWAAMYGQIASCNYLIERAQALVDGGSLTEEEVAEVNRYIGEAHFFRAWDYFYLFDHFCMTYDPAKGDTPALGIPLVTVYAPTGDTSAYPGRSTMNQTISLISDDLDAAYTALKAYEDAGNVECCVAGSAYLSSYVVEALRARIALVTGDYDTAIDKAQIVIGNTEYQLAKGNDYLDMWADANVSELIFAPFVDVNESGTISSTCEGWNYWWSNANQSDYIPMEWTVRYFFDPVTGKNNDIRFKACFKSNDCVVQSGKAKAYVFNKWPGNPSLSSGTDMFLNTPKPFRLSEMYCILAEAGARSGNTTVANDAINALREARMTKDYAELTLAGQELIDEAVRQRTLELIGEGFRMSDLRRWHVAWTRDQNYGLSDAINESIAIQSRMVSYSADDYRYVWPIPANEIEINPQIAGQQNRGY